MQREELAGHIEHTVLGPTTTRDDVTGLLDVAIANGMRACVPPCYVSLASDYAPGVGLSTVVGFPHGQHGTETKASEATELANSGADELDLVPNLGALRAGDDDRFRQDVAEVVAATTCPLKVIIEAPLLSTEEKHRAARLAVDAGADFLKTATGFADGGARTEDVELLSAYLPVKASGGVGTWERASEMFDTGAKRIGTSSGHRVLGGFTPDDESG